MCHWNTKRMCHFQWNATFCLFFLFFPSGIASKKKNYCEFENVQRPFVQSRIKSKWIRVKTTSQMLKYLYVCRISHALHLFSHFNAVFKISPVEKFLHRFEFVSPKTFDVSFLSFRFHKRNHSWMVNYGRQKFAIFAVERITFECYRS